jgi:A/G-specific adenine glycosylase
MLIPYSTPRAAFLLPFPPAERPYTSRMTELSASNTSKPRSDSALDRFRGDVWDYYRANRREMPWRDVDDPYAVLVSEVMLQQTQVVRVIDRYREWMAAFPTLQALAAASLSAVLELWQGLGYNRRAVALKRAAEETVERFGGALPRDAAALRTLPGVGPTTAAALLNYAFQEPAPFIETNVRAVFLHHFFPDAEGVPDSALMPLVEAAWDLSDPRGWGYALMDYGVFLKRSETNPSRRSRHHARQSRFEGSKRQTRARLLRAVLAAPGGPSEAYAEDSGVGTADADALLEELASEGFLACEAGRWIVAGS